MLWYHMKHQLLLKKHASTIVTYIGYHGNMKALYKHPIFRLLKNDVGDPSFFLSNSNKQSEIELSSKIMGADSKLP